MRLIYYPFLLVSVCIILAGCADQNARNPAPPSIKIMSYNIRYANPNDGVNRWNKRKERVVNFITFYQPDFLGTQEVLYSQLTYLEKALPKYGRIGVGRKDGKKGGEFSALFYDTGRFELVEGTAQTLWLSKIPNKPSKSWDAALPRIVTFGKFRDLKIGKTLWVFNTHFDHRGETARQESARLVVEIIKKVSNNEPVILMGDFNITEKMKPYKILTASTSPLKDSFYASGLAPIGPLFTFEGFEVSSPHSKRRIDYIFVNNRLKVKKFATLPTYRKGYHLSDHLPIIAVVAFAK